MIRALVIIVVGLLMTPGCLNIGPSEQAAIVYYHVAMSPEPWSADELPVTVVLAPFSAGEALDREEVRYRTSDVEGGYWGDHRWSESVASMVRSALERDLDSSGLFRHVLILDSAGSADILLRGEVHRFEEEDREDGWYGVAEVSLEVLETHTGTLHHFRYEVAEKCEAATVREVVRALSRALGKIFSYVRADLAATIAGVN